MTRTKRYLAAAAATVALAATVPSVAHAVTTGTAAHGHRSVVEIPKTSSAVPPAPTAAKAPAIVPPARAVAETPVPAPPARVVAAGQRVDAGNGVSVWLKAEGKYTSVPGQDVLFQPKKDGQQRDGVNLQAQPLAGKWFVSGTYLENTAAARVVVVASDGTSLRGCVLRLRGAHDWGAFYVPLSVHLPHSASGPMRLPVKSVTLYDAAGKVITSMSVGG